MTPEGIDTAVGSNAQFPHMVNARMLYISNATELGTVYSRDELVAL